MNQAVVEGGSMSEMSCPWGYYLLVLCSLEALALAGEWMQSKER